MTKSSAYIGEKTETETKSKAETLLTRPAHAVSRAVVAHVGRTVFSFTRDST